MGGAGPGHVLNVKGWSGDEEVLRFDVTNTGHGGITARITGKLDWRGTVNCDVDLDDPPWAFGAAAPNIRAGAVGVIRKFIGPTKFFQVPVVVAKVHYESAVESEVKYSFDVEMSILYGAYIYPAG